MIRLSDVYRDRVASALDTAVHWAEYVIKYHGAAHLSYAGKKLNWVQTYCLDIVAVLVVLLLNSTCVAKVVIVTVYKRLTSSKHKNKNKKFN